MLTSVLLRNLLDNALRYNPEGVRVSVSVTADGKQVTLRVEDSGLGWSIVRRMPRSNRPGFPSAAPSVRVGFASR